LLERRIAASFNCCPSNTSDAVESIGYSTMTGVIHSPRIVDKPWGREVWYAHNDLYAGKVLEVTAGHLLSLQKHEVKHETLFLQSGRMLFTREEEVFEWTPGEAIEIPPGTVHRMEAIEDSVILEVSTPQLDDVVRLEDRYGRTPD
jgi:mannose-6-phosphate isomerase-like protein (cupin superfamily)